MDFATRHVSKDCDDSLVVMEDGHKIVFPCRRQAGHVGQHEARYPISAVQDLQVTVFWFRRFGAASQELTEGGGND